MAHAKHAWIYACVVIVSYGDKLSSICIRTRMKEKEQEGDMEDAIPSILECLRSPTSQRLANSLEDHI